MEWIKCSDRDPDIGRFILVYDPNDYYGVHCEYFKHVGWYEKDSCWMYINEYPKPPKENNEMA